MENNIKQMYQTLNYEFNDEKILKEALSPPYANKQISVNNMIEFTRLKWLGDSILDMVVTDFLYNYYPEDSEGELTRKKNSLVSAELLFEIGKEIKIPDFIHCNQECRQLTSNRQISNAIEAIVGAIYIDGGLEKVKSFISHHWKPLFVNIETNFHNDLHPKTNLQMWTEKNKLPLPEYTIVSSSGPNNEPTYQVKAYVKEVGEAIGTGHSIREAEKQAANILLDRIKETELKTKRNKEEGGECSLN